MKSWLVDSLMRTDYLSHRRLQEYGGWFESDSSWKEIIIETTNYQAIEYYLMNV